MRGLAALGAALILSCALVSQAPAQSAGPVAAFEQEVAAVYAHYRRALFATNQKDTGASAQAIEAFAKGWSAAIGPYREAPPPQYAGDPSWSQTLADVEAVLAAAKVDLTQSGPEKAHETLERIRDLLWDMRARNGIVTFSDRMNAYHEQMERVLLGTYEGLSEKGLGDLRDDVAVLSHLAELLGEHLPATHVGNGEFAKGLEAVKASVRSLHDALRKDDLGAIRSLKQALKKPYSMLFLKFG